MYEFYDGVWWFIWSDVLKRCGHSFGRWNYHSIGALFLYLTELELEFEEPVECEGILWFFFYGWEGGKIYGDH